MNYQDQLKSPKWQKKRLDILNLRGFKCEKCNCEENQLHVHHRFYLKNRKAWEYDNDIFQVLCHICHENEHKKEQYKKFDLNQYVNSQLKDLEKEDIDCSVEDCILVINELLNITNYYCNFDKVYLQMLLFIIKNAHPKETETIESIIEIVFNKIKNTQYERMD